MLVTRSQPTGESRNFVSKAVAYWRGDAVPQTSEARRNSGTMTQAQRRTAVQRAEQIKRGSVAERRAIGRFFMGFC